MKLMWISVSLLVLSVQVKKTWGSVCSCSCSSDPSEGMCPAGTNANPEPPNSRPTNTSGSGGYPECPDQGRVLNVVSALQSTVYGIRNDLAYVKTSVNNLKESIPDTINKSLNITWTVVPGADNANTSFPGDIIYEGIHKTHPRDCREVRDAGDSRGDGLYRIYDPAEDRFINVRCGMYCDGGGWLEIMRRDSGRENFNRTWNEYANGFGDLKGEFWMGLEYLHKITKQYKNLVLRVDVATFEDDHKYVQYDKFTVGDSSTKYKLNVGTHTGSAGTALGTYGNNKMFSTYDKDNDALGGKNCALVHGGGWWFYATGSCGHVWPTGKVDANLQKTRIGGIALGTSYATNGYVVYKSAVMKVRPAFGLP